MMPNISDTARDLALAWVAAGHWGDPNCNDAYEAFFLSGADCPDSLADALVTNRSDIIIIRAYAARMIGQHRRALSFEPMPAKNRWPQTEEDGA